jgi:ribose transport system permease protein
VTDRGGPGGPPAPSDRVLAIALRLIQSGPIVILVALACTMAILSPVFLSQRNLTNLGIQTSTVALLAVGELLVILTRGVDLSVGSTIALSGVLGAMVMDTSVGSGGTAILAIVLTGAGVGLLNGLLLVKARIPHPLIVTLATLTIVRGLALAVSDGETRIGVPEAVLDAGSGYLLGVPVPVLIVVGLGTLAAVLTRRTQWGRWVYAVGGDPEAASRAGIPVDRVLLGAYVLCGTLAGVAGLILSGRTGAGAPTAGQLAELDAITAVIIGGASFFGGRGTVGNALVGALIIGLIRNGLNLLDVSPFMQLIAVGLVILLAIELDVLRGRIETRLRVLHTNRESQHG